MKDMANEMEIARMSLSVNEKKKERKDENECLLNIHLIICKKVKIVNIHTQNCAIRGILYHFTQL